MRLIKVCSNISYLLSKKKKHLKRNVLKFTVYIVLFFSTIDPSYIVDTLR